jgi:histone deacetylase complex subunit SAP18
LNKELTIRKSSTPTSLIALLYPTFPAPYRSPIARFAFRHVYVDASQRGLYRSKDLVSFTGKELMSTISKDDDRGRKVDEKTLDEYGFITGDYISVSLHIPEPKVQNPLPQRSAPLGGREEKRNIDGDWARGEALPPAPRGGGRGGYGAGNGGRVMGMGIRGGARRSPSVTRDGGRRSRSPERRGGRRDRSLD